MSSSASLPKTSAAESGIRRILEEFVVGNSELQQLESLLRKFNLFDALKLVRYEIRHSDFLAYLLDPQQSHGLRDSFLKGLLQLALKGAVNSNVTPIHIDLWTLTSANVHREWKNLDIFIRDERNRLAVLIENKVLSDEHSNQLARYYDHVSREYPGWNIVPIYLTIDSDSPSDKRFLPLGYAHICALVEGLIGLSSSSLNADVRMTMEHYAEMLRRYFVSESEISQLCRDIYTKHKQALDIIYEHRPDRQQTVRELLEGMIRENSELELDDSTKSYIRFIPKRLDADLLRKGSGWTSSGRILLFEAHNAQDHVSLRLYIGPGLEETRRKLFDFVQTAQPPFKIISKTKTLNEQWNAIYSHKLLTPKAYDLRDEEFKMEVEKQWKQFVERELPPLVTSLEKRTWLKATTGR